ncbi:MAG: hypothetical protein ACM3H7_04430 [Acidobacteriaceae bacterium]
MIQPLVVGAVILVSLAALFILASRDWRYCIAVLAVQYIGVFLLTYASWPLELAIVKMVAGWMAGAILGMAMTSLPAGYQENKASIIFGPFVRIMAAAILILAISSLVIHSQSWLAMIDLPIRWGSFMLIGIGLLQLSLTSHPFRVIIGLLTALSGFEVIYAAIETSTLVTGLLAGVNIGLALVGAYLLIAPTMEAAQ